MRRPGRSVIIALALVAVVVGTWFVRGLSAERRAAQARWDEREPSAYSFVYAYCGGMCEYCPARITVRDGTVVDATTRESGCGAPSVEHAPTIEDLFVIAADHQPWSLVGRTSVSYDDHWGFPTSITFTCGEGVTDCGGGWAVSDFEAIS